MSAFFGLAAVIFSQAKVLGSVVLIITLLIVIGVLAEKIGLVGKNYKPLLKFIKGIRYSKLKTEIGHLKKSVLSTGIFLYT